MCARSFLQLTAYALVATSVTLTSILVGHAQVMQSGSYQIQSDSLNVGGGFSTSTNYIQESTVSEVGTGRSDSSSYSLRAGYQQMQSVYLALAGGANVTMDPINGLTGGTANGSTTYTATTDSSGGYQLTIAAEESPAMTSNGNSIADYSPDTANPDLHFTTGNNESHYAYSPFGSHTAQRFQTNGSACNVSGLASTTACWDGLSTTAETIAQSTAANHPAGTVTDIYFRVGIGPSVLQTEGVYTATSTVTLLAL